jgi:hypothetical protein
MPRLTLADKAERLRAAWRARGWPDDLLKRAQQMHVRASRLQRWAGDDRWTPAKVRDALERQARAPGGGLKVRAATPADNDALVDLYASSPSDQGDREVTVERGPFAFAQYCLQDESELQVVEDRGELLAVLAHARTRMRAGGIDTPVYIPIGWRVRKDVRGQGLGPLLQKGSSQRFAGKHTAMLYYRRRGGRKTPLAEVYWYPASLDAARSSRVRRAARSDIDACVALINGMMARHFDVHPIYDAAYLAGKLDADERTGRPPVYGWSDYYVIDDAGAVVACAGLWDRGRHLRERWRSKATGEAWTIANSALIDFGYAEGREDVMAALIEHLVGVSAELGRDYLMAPFQFLPALAARLEHLRPEQEMRAWYWNNNAALRSAGFNATRPYMDLAYW